MGPLPGIRRNWVTVFDPMVPRHHLGSQPVISTSGWGGRPVVPARAPRSSQAGHRQPGHSPRRRQPWLRSLDEAIARNLKELGYDG